MSVMAHMWTLCSIKCNPSSYMESYSLI